MVRDYAIELVLQCINSFVSSPIERTLRHIFSGSDVGDCMVDFYFR
jgi:hypothetical protein